jgi:hypothetical protein
VCGVRTRGGGVAGRELIERETGVVHTDIYRCFVAPRGEASEEAGY